MRLTAVLLFLSITGIAVAQPNIGGVVNGASFDKDEAIAPGSLVSIFGTKFAKATAAADSIPLSTSLGGVTVKFTNGSKSIDAPLLFANSEQINAVVPWELVPSGVTANVGVEVSTSAGSSNSFTIAAKEFSPGIITVGGTLAAVQNTDGTLAQPPGSIAGRTTHPAAPGEVIVIYTTGLGPVNPSVPDGHIPPSGTLARTLHIPFVSIGGHSAHVEFSGLSPQFVGVYQLNVTVPNVTGDNLEVQLSLGGITTLKGVTMAVSQ